MSANIRKVNGQAAMVYAKDGGVPWHKEGVAVDTAMSMEEALELAQLNDQVILEKIRLVDGPQIVAKRATVRVSDRQVLGIVSPHYKPIQNRDALGFMDSLYSDGKLLYDTAGQLGNGSIVWALARMTEDMRIGDDVYGKYLLVTTAHDGLHSLTVHPTAVRVVCENTLLMATSEAASIIIRHTGDIDSKMEAARAVWKITDERHRRLETWLNTMSTTEVEEDFVQTVEEKLFGTLDEATPTQRRNAIEAFRAVYSEEREAVGTTAYAVVNAITGYADHKTRVKATGTRMGSMLAGTSFLLKNKGLREVQRLTKTSI